MTRDDVVDPALAASYARGLARSGLTVTIQRVNGEAPRTATVSARVPAVIYDRGGAPSPDEAGIGVGALTQSDRWLVVAAADLARARFPLPVGKDDRVILPGDGSSKLTITDVDALKRAKAGAIEIKAQGL